MNKSYIVISVFIATCICAVPPFSVEFLDQKISNFDFSDTRTYKQKYLINKDQFSADNGCILFYTGNEAPIEVFYNSTGFVTETLAKKFRALVVFG